MEKEILKELNDVGLNISRLISASKSSYRERKPNNLVYFNANIFVYDYGKIWWGDIDITEDHIKLNEIAKKLNVHLYILSEQDGRFDNENRSDFELVSVWNTETGLSDRLKEYVDEITLKLKK